MKRYGNIAVKEIRISILAIYSMHEPFFRLKTNYELWKQLVDRKTGTKLKGKNIRNKTTHLPTTITPWQPPHPHTLHFHATHAQQYRISWENGQHKEFTLMSITTQTNWNYCVHDLLGMIEVSVVGIVWCEVFRRDLAKNQLEQHTWLYETAKKSYFA